jgi:tetratricopeptide (TPR) repeat protein
MTDEIAAFHRRVAEALAAHYTTNERAPEGWQEILAWHWEQSGALSEAAAASLEVAEARVARLDFVAARQWAERTLGLIEKLGPVVRRAYELRAYALALAVLEFGGQFREGLDYARRMLKIAQKRGNIEAEARAQLAIGRMQRELTQLAAAEAALQQARVLAERGELYELEAEVRVHLAKVHQLQGRHLEALQELQLAQEEQEQHDDHVKLARVFTGIGDIYRVLGSGREALTFYTRALSLEQGRGSRLGQAILKDKLALALLAQNRLEEAFAAEEESLQLRESLNDVVGLARSHSVLGRILSQLGRAEEALAHHERAYTLEGDIQNPRGQGIALVHLGDTARILRRYDKARQYYQQGLAVTRRDNDQIGQARTIERIGDLSAEESLLEEAINHWIEALKIREALHHSDEASALRERIRTGSAPRR